MKKKTLTIALIMATIGINANATVMAEDSLIESSQLIAIEEQSTNTEALQTEEDNDVKLSIFAKIKKLTADKKQQRIAKKEKKKLEKTAIQEAEELTENVNENVSENIFDNSEILDSDKLEKKLEENKVLRTQIDTASEVAKKIDLSVEKQQIKGDVSQIVNIDDCVQIALANNPSIISAKSSADIYKSQIAQAWANYFPKVSVGGEYSRNDMMVSAFSPQTQKYNMFYLPTAGINWTLFDFGKTKAQADIAKKTYEASEDNVQKNINDVIFDVKRSYYNLLFSLQKENICQESVKDYEVHLEQAKAYYRIGSKAKIDVLTAEYNLGKAKLDLIKAKNEIKLNYANVNNAIGMPEFSNYAIDEKLDTGKYNLILEDLLETAFKTRPEYLASQKKAKASELLVRASKRAFLPDLSAFGSIQYGGINPGNDVGYQFGANLSYNNLNALLLKKQVDESRATAKRDEADLEKQRQTVYLEVKQAYIDFTNAQDSIPVAELAMIQAKEQYDLASGRYKVGLGDAVELKDAETTYRQAQLEYYANLMNYNIAAANIERVIGAPINAMPQDKDN